MINRLRFAQDALDSNRNWQLIVFSDENDLYPEKQGKNHHRKYRGEHVDVDYGPEDIHDARKNKVWGQ